MADFETETELQVAVEQRSLRDARRTIESELSDVSVSVESTPDTRAMRPDGGAGAFGGSGVGQSMVDLQSEQVELLESIDDSLEGVAGMGGGGGGGLLPPSLAGAASGAASGAGLRALLGGAMSSLGLSLAMTPGSPLFMGSGGKIDREQIDRVASGNERPGDLGPLMSFVGPALRGLRPMLQGLVPGAAAGQQFRNIPNSPFSPPGAAGPGGGSGGFLSQFTQATQALRQTPQWISEFARQVDRLQNFNPGRPEQLAQDPTNIGQPESGPIGPGSSGRRGRADQAGRGNVSIDMTSTLTIEDQRDIEQEMERYKTETIRELERRMNQGVTEI